MRSFPPPFSSILPSLRPHSSSSPISFPGALSSSSVATPSPSAAIPPCKPGSRNKRNSPRPRPHKPASTPPPQRQPHPILALPCSAYPSLPPCLPPPPPQNHSSPPLAP